MIKAAFFILALGVVFNWQKISNFFGPPADLSRIVQAQKDHPCFQKKQCAVIYVAPWCPACKQMSPVIQTLLKNYSSFKRDVGLIVVIGHGNEDATNEEEARGLGNYKEVIIDHDLKYSQDLQISHFPTFLVLDEKYKEMKKGQAAIQWAIEQFGN